MKRIYTSTTKYSSGLGAILTAFILMSCAKSIEFMPSTMVPGAEGKVTVKKDKNKNYAIQVNVVNLASPNQLATPKTNYVVWMETPDSGTQNLGGLTSGKGLFSKANKAILETVTPYRPTKFIITAENQVDSKYPGSEVVMQTEGNGQGLVRNR